MFRDSCSEGCDESEKQVQNQLTEVTKPIVMALVIPSMFSLGQRFILDNMVTEKANKTRETLRLMSLSRFSYASSFFLFQGLISFIQGIVIGIGFGFNKTLFTVNPVSQAAQFCVAVVLYSLGSIPFCMAASTFFSDAKLANMVGGLFLLIPQLLFVYLSTQPAPTCFGIYALYWVPVMPACSIFSSLTVVEGEGSIVSLKWLSVPATWASMVVNIPLWILIYIYLDSVMPSDFGIHKHPCFCFFK